MKNLSFILLIGLFSLLSHQAEAIVTCHTDSLGNEICNGTNDKGDYVNTRSRTDILGNTYTTGNIGSNNVNTRSRTDSLGNTYTTGNIGHVDINTRSRTDSLGYTNYYQY